MSRRARAVGLAVISLTLSGCFGDSTPEIQGYVEGTYVYVSAEAAGMVVERPATDGDAVDEGALLVRLDEPEQKEAVAGAEARVAQAKAQLADLRSGKRPEEVSVIAAELQKALSALNLAEENYQRQVVLRGRGIVAQSVVDDAKNQRDSNKASAEAIERQLLVAKLPARPEEIAAAERNVAAEEAALAQALIQLERRRLTAPAAGRIEETFFEVGERVTAGQPVISLLPASNVKVRFFLPEEKLASIQIGDRIAVTCDGCEDGLSAEIDRIATEAEFTPPVL
nr:HlyD family efflux transporter periplasmic adaptor subunit [Gammaproteobacteria bacterium]